MVEEEPMNEVEKIVPEQNKKGKRGKKGKNKTKKRTNKVFERLLLGNLHF